jgi:hypothetical protein
MGSRKSVSPGSNGSGHHAERSLLEAAANAHRNDPLATVLAGRGLGPYRGYGEILEAVGDLERRGARLRVIGRSVKREPLFAIHLGAAQAPRVRTTVVLAGLHPTEWIGVETALRLLDRLVSRDLGERAVVAIPVANPDGYVRVEGNLRKRRRRFERHNAHGVDLNRNFDARWGKQRLVQRLVPWVFAPGQRPFSEPESEAVAHSLHDRRVDRAVSLHSFGGAVLYPQAGSLWPIADAAEHRAWATRIARAADRRPYRALPCAWWAYGIAQGGLELDWFHERHGAISLLVECSRGGIGFRSALGRNGLRVGGLGRLFEPFAWFNPPDIEAVTWPLAEALEPFVRGERLRRDEAG